MSQDQRWVTIEDDLNTSCMTCFHSSVQLITAYLSVSLNPYARALDCALKNLERILATAPTRDGLYNEYMAPGLISTGGCSLPTEAEGVHV